MNPLPDLLHHRPGGSDPADTQSSNAMSDYKSDFLRVLSERGFIHQISDAAGLDAAAAAKKASSPMSATTAPRRRCTSGT